MLPQINVYSYGKLVVTKSNLPEATKRTEDISDLLDVLKFGETFTLCHSLQQFSPYEI